MANKDDANKTLANFRRHFQDADQDRRHSTITAGSAGYHGANAAVNNTNPAPAAKPTPAPPANTATIVSPRGPDLRPNTSYCWSHGFLKNPKHNALSCKFKHDGHQDATTTATN